MPPIRGQSRLCRIGDGAVHDVAGLEHNGPVGPAARMDCVESLDRVADDAGHAFVGVEGWLLTLVARDFAAGHRNRGVTTRTEPI